MFFLSLSFTLGRKLYRGIVNTFMLLLFTLLFNMGLPMIFPAFFFMLVALLPIVFVEAYSLRFSLKIDFLKALKFASVANLISTVVGIPVTWLLLLIFQLITGGGVAYGIDSFWQKFLAVTWQAAWLIPYEKEFYWMAYAAGLFLLIPFFFASWFLEYLTIRKTLANELFFKREKASESNDSNSMIKKFETEEFSIKIRKAVRDANLLSYGLLATYLLIIIASAILRGK